MTTRASTAGAARRSPTCSTWKSISRKSKVIKLEQNYRSTNTILNAANASSSTTPAAAANSSGPRKGRARRSRCTPLPPTRRRRGPIAEQIEFARLAQRVPWADQAILFRTNAQSRPLETALRQAGVRYHLIGGQSFFDRREIRDFLAYLKVLLNPQRRRQPAAHRQRPGARAERCDDGAPAGRQPRAQMPGVRRDEEPGGDDHLPGQDAREHRGALSNSSSARADACTTKPASHDPHALQSLADRFLERSATSPSCAAPRRIPRPPRTASATSKT